MPNSKRELYYWYLSSTLNTFQRFSKEFHFLVILWLLTDNYRLTNLEMWPFKCASLGSHTHKAVLLIILLSLCFSCKQMEPMVIWSLLQRCTTMLLMSISSLPAVLKHQMFALRKIFAKNKITINFIYFLKKN